VASVRLADLVDRRPLLILISSTSLLAILTPARKVGSLPFRLQQLVADRLVRLGITTPLIDAEIAAMHRVHVGPTRNRSVLGLLVEFAKDTAFLLPIRNWGEVALLEVEDYLARTPWQASGPSASTIFPNKVAPKLLEARWAPADSS